MHSFGFNKTVTATKKNDNEWKKVFVKSSINRMKSVFETKLSKNNTKRNRISIYLKSIEFVCASNRKQYNTYTFLFWNRNKVDDTLFFVIYVCVCVSLHGKKVCQSHIPNPLAQPNVDNTMHFESESPGERFLNTSDRNKFAQHIQRERGRDSTKTQT